MTSTSVKPDSPDYGSLVLATPQPGAAVWPRWPSAHRHCKLAKFWEAVAGSEQFPPAGQEELGDTGTVGAALSLQKGESADIPFFICWYFPNFEHWEKEQCSDDACCAQTRGKTWKNYYASTWKDAWDVAGYVARNFEPLETQTRLFRDTLYASTLPSYLLDAVGSQISVLKTPTCLRLPDGDFYGFEGCNDTSGCCEGSCTHVWNYAQALPYLFPSLQRSMLEAHLFNAMQDDGFVQFRLPLPPGTKARPSYHPAADGQMGMIMQVYREWLICGDRAWLE